MTDEQTTPTKIEDMRTSMVSTICYNCVFADYTDNVQTGCKANRLELFKQQKQEINEVDIDGKTCFVLEGKACVYYRNKDWAVESYKTEDTDTIFDIVKKQLNIPYHAILFFRSDDAIEDKDKRLTE